MRDLALSRDQKVLEGIEKHKYIRTDQVAQLWFTTIKDKDQRQKKAAARLRTMHKRKMVQRMRFPGTPYIWYLNGSRYSTKMNHYLAIVDALIEIQTAVPAGSVLDYEVEVKQGNIITDLLLHYRNDFRGQCIDFYIEVELDSSADVIEKIKKYEDLFLDHNLENSTLAFICKHRRTINRIQEKQFDIPVQAIDLYHIAERWQWS